MFEDLNEVLERGVCAIQLEAQKVLDLQCAMPQLETRITAIVDAILTACAQAVRPLAKDQMVAYSRARAKKLHKWLEGGSRTWDRPMVMAAPAVKPAMTEWLKKAARKPSCSAPTTNQSKPTRKVICKVVCRNEQHASYKHTTRACEQQCNASMRATVQRQHASNSAQICVCNRQAHEQI